MEAWMAFVSIIAIVGIVLVAGALIAFIGHMIIGAVDKDNKVNTSKNEVIDYSQFKQLENKTEQNSNVEAENDFEFDAIDESKAEAEKLEAESKTAEIVADEESNILDEIKDDESAEQKAAETENIEAVEDQSKEDNVSETSEEPKQETLFEDDEDADLDDLLDEISNDVIEEAKAEAETENAPKMSEELESYTIDDYLNNNESEETEQSEQLEAETESVEEVAEQPVEENKVVEDNSKEIIEQLKAQLAELNDQLEQAKNNKAEVVAINMTEEECLNRIAVLEERLKNVKKDYKINLKEYRPLKKVINDLERNQAKLRRKEAIVAKKKVALYGVNNYVDIDKEKAEKLANELELLEGLRLSVNHCEEVINANKDRYPILEHTNQILEDEIANIEADLASTQETLAKIREQNGEDGDQGNTVDVDLQQEVEENSNAESNETENVESAENVEEQPVEVSENKDDSIVNETVETETQSAEVQESNVEAVETETPVEEVKEEPVEDNGSNDAENPSEE